MKTTLFMAASANGYAARPDGAEDFLADANWNELVRYAKQYQNLIWGRKTYENVKKWGGNYLKKLNGVDIIIVSNNKKLADKNITICNSPIAAIEIIKSRKYKNALLSGGPTLNAAFAEGGLIDEVIINYNPTILSDGINIFNKNKFELKLKFKKVTKLKSNIVQINYSVANK